MELLDGMVVSYQVHILKPDARIYRCLLEKYNLNPAECVFLDDLEANTAAAKREGIGAITIASEEQLLRELDTLLSKKEEI